MKMKVFKTVCAQGDVYIRRVNMEIPKNAIEVQPEGKYVIVTHSETNHNHVMEKEKVKMYQLPDSIMKCLLVVSDPVALEHLRDYDTHEPILFEPGTYEVHRQREYTPEGFRKVQD
jgi:hypothetical protein